MGNSNNTKVTSHGIGFVGLLTIAFTVLKLVGIITWSWFWVLSPIWISVLLWVVAAVALIVYVVVHTKE